MGVFLKRIQQNNDNKTPATAAGASHINPFEDITKKDKNNVLNKTIDFLQSDTGVNK